MKVYLLRIWLTLALLHICSWDSIAQEICGKKPDIAFTVSFPESRSHSYHVEMSISGMDRDTLLLHMPRWMPGYYQIMDYAEDISAICARDSAHQLVALEPVSNHSWQVIRTGEDPLVIQYDVKTRRKFVANSYVDSAAAYILPANSFLYMQEYLNNSVTVEILPRKEWPRIVTGLEPVSGSSATFYAPDYDILYDCPILAGNLEELPAFEVNGVEHRFIGTQLGTFDVPYFVDALKKIVATAVKMFGDVPYTHYTFIGIGPGRGGIEHLNNTTVSFDGNTLSERDSYKRVLAFLAHEYFHHYNVKRIRPFELGPFDYGRENRTNQLWISEGLTVYYEYLLLRRAGLIDETELLQFLSGDITAYENDYGRQFQSLQEASYYTWEEGPFGMHGGVQDRSISIYEKGAIVGLLLDFRIRNATRNRQSMDDVMRLLYREYYQNQQRGFTEAEFQQACEQVAGTSLADIFQYVYTTNEPDYQKYLGMAGLQLEQVVDHPGDNDSEVAFTISRLPDPDQQQLKLLNSWQNE